MSDICLEFYTVKAVGKETGTFHENVPKKLEFGVHHEAREASPIELEEVISFFYPDVMITVCTIIGPLVKYKYAVQKPTVHLNLFENHGINNTVHILKVIFIYETMSSETCAFPSWPRRPTLSDVSSTEPRTSSYISDDDLSIPVEVPPVMEIEKHRKLVAIKRVKAVMKRSHRALTKA